MAMKITGAGFFADLLLFFAEDRFSPSFSMSWSRARVWSRGREQAKEVGNRGGGGGAVADMAWQI